MKLRHFTYPKSVKQSYFRCWQKFCNKSIVLVNNAIRGYFSLKIYSWKLKDTKILFSWNFIPLRHLHQRFMTQRSWKTRFRKLWPVQSWTLFLKIWHHILHDEPSKFLTFNSPLLFKPYQCVLDLNRRIWKPYYFFNYPSFPNTKIFNTAIYSSIVGYENCMSTSGVAIICVM